MEGEGFKGIGKAVQGGRDNAWWGAGATRPEVGLIDPGGGFWEGGEERFCWDRTDCGEGADCPGDAPVEVASGAPIGAE